MNKNTIKNKLDNIFLIKGKIKIISRSKLKKMIKNIKYLIELEFFFVLLNMPHSISILFIIFLLLNIKIFNNNIIIDKINTNIRNLISICLINILLYINIIKPHLQNVNIK